MGWNFYQEVTSKVTKRIERENKLILVIPKKEPSVKWTSFMVYHKSTTIKKSLSSNICVSVIDKTSAMFAKDVRGGT